MDYDRFENDVETFASRYNVYRESFADIADYYKDQNGNNWRPAMAIGLSGTSDKKSKEYKAALRTVQRQSPENPNAKQKHSKPSNALKGKLKDLGKKLPPIGRRYPKRIKINIPVFFEISETKLSRNVEARLSGVNAITFLDSPSMFTLIDIWGDGNLDANEWTDGTIDYGSPTIVEEG